MKYLKRALCWVTGHRWKDAGAGMVGNVFYDHFECGCCGKRDSDAFYVNLR